MLRLLGALRGPRTPLLARACSRSCAGPVPPPPAPPCAPPPRPACRPPPPCSTPLAVRRVCCAPPRSRQPPCPAPLARAPLTCLHRRSENACGDSEPGDECGAGQDRVARRLAAAAAARRRRYEEEASACARTPRAPPAPAVYAPGAARDCLRATDGRTYGLPCALPPPARCGPRRTPPPPEPVPLARGPACGLSAAPDSCAHRPRVFLEVDRDPPSAPPPPPPAPAPLPAAAAPGACAAPAPPARGLAERIVAGLRGQGAPPPPRRALHTRALREAGRGRESLPCAPPPAASAPHPCARLDLPVPPGAERVHVLVSVRAGDAEGAGCAKPCASDGEATMMPATAAERRDSWLSIGSIRKKLSGCGPPAPTCPPRPPAPAPPAAPAPPCQRTPPCPPAPMKPKSSPCDRKESGSKTKRCFAPLPLLI